MDNTRKRICDTAIRLFNERGYGEVSLREIAKEADTTIGNLTYHFKKKEDLLIVLVTELHESYSFFFSADLSGGDLLIEILNSFKRAEDNRKNYTFYFENLGELVHLSEYILSKLQAFQKKLYDYYLLSFRVLQGENIIKKEIELISLHLLACTLVNISGSWGSLISPYSNELISNSSYSETCCDMLRPFLCDEYIEKIETWKQSNC